MKRWIAVGDSFTYLNDHLDETKYRVKKGYLTRTLEHLQADGIELDLINMGINGSCTTLWNGGLYSLMRFDASSFFYRSCSERHQVIHFLFSHRPMSWSKAAHNIPAIGHTTQVMCQAFVRKLSRR